MQLIKLSGKSPKQKDVSLIWVVKFSKKLKILLRDSAYMKRENHEASKLWVCSQSILRDKTHKYDLTLLLTELLWKTNIDYHIATNSKTENKFFFFFLHKDTKSKVHNTLHMKAPCLAHRRYAINFLFLTDFHRLVSLSLPIWEGTPSSVFFTTNYHKTITYAWQESRQLAFILLILNSFGTLRLTAYNVPVISNISISLKTCIHQKFYGQQSHFTFEGKEIDILF